jgi:predicted membrane protein
MDDKKRDPSASGVIVKVHGVGHVVGIPNVVTGAVITALGVVLLLDHMGIASARQFFHFWPVLLIAVGLAHLFQTNRLDGRLWGGFLIVMGALFQLNELGYARFRFTDIWPLLIILVGLMLVVRELGSRRGGSNSSAPEIGEAQFDSVSIFGGTDRRVNAQNFKSGKLFAMFGGYKVDLTGANLEGNEAVIDASAIMGGGEIRVPEDWNVIIRGLAIFGAYTDETRLRLPAGTTASKNLIVKGIAIFGGIVIKN